MEQLLAGVQLNETSRNKILNHDLRDGTKWRLPNNGGDVQYPDKFEMFDGDNNVGSEFTEFSIVMLEVSQPDGGFNNYLIVNYNIHNHSWNHKGDMLIYISLFDANGIELFKNVDSFYAGRGSCNYGGRRKMHHELQINPASIFPSVASYQLRVPTISGTIGGC